MQSIVIVQIFNSMWKHSKAYKKQTHLEIKDANLINLQRFSQSANFVNLFTSLLPL